MAPPPPRVFTIPASVPFLPTLIEALVGGRLVPGFAAGHDPLALAKVTLYLPTRRACRIARDTFLATLRAEAAILPRIVAIGDVDADEIAFAEASNIAPATAALDLPEALGGLERKTLLAELILKWAAAPGMRAAAGASLVASSPAGALGLAGDLARLMDDMITRQVPWDRLDGLVPDDVDEYWQRTLTFLQIARTQWPAILAERGAIEPAERRDRLIEAERARLKQHDGPVIAAGSTGSMPATAALLETIANLPHGAVVLPGLDTDLDAAAWELIGDEKATGPSHPQFAMQALLRRIGIAREAVVELTSPAPHGRERLISETLRPAEATELWQQQLARADFSTHADAALAGLSVIEAANAEEEALAIAIALREVVEAPDKTAALVTPDRALARRVVAALARWQVPVDDSGGDALSDTPAGVFARLVAEAALGGLAPVTLLAMLKHRLCNVDPNAVATLERALLRGPRPRRGTAGLAHALKSLRQARDQLHRNDPRSALEDADLDTAEKLLAQLAAALEPLEALRGKLRFLDIAARHRDAIRALGDETDDLAEAFDEIAQTAQLAVTATEYAELFHAAIADRVVRRPEADVRVRIFVPLEARLQSVARMVLGGLTEGVWPPETRSDPWLSRPMRHELGLDLPERRIGLSAHDFAQALGAKEIVLSHAAKLAGAPTVASRFVQRLAAVAGEARWQAAVRRGETYLAWARQIDTPAKVERIARPAPTPPLATRPQQLSVTEIEHWLRDPYTIYAKHILRLAPLEQVDAPLGARDRGIAIHESIGEFTKAFAAALPTNAQAELERIGRRHFALLEDYPEARALWWPRFLRIARWISAEFEPERRPRIAALHAEIRGEIAIPLGALSFKLSARADRIERLTDGRYAILDYKTGRLPGHDEVKVGLAPQLTLEAAILRRGGFSGIPTGASVSDLAYIGLKGGDPPGELRVVNLKGSTADAEADRALARLTGVAAKFAEPTTPYLSLVHPMWRARYGDYDHLARVKEWSLTGGDEGDGG